MKRKKRDENSRLAAAHARSNCLTVSQVEAGQRREPTEEKVNISTA